MEQRLKTKIMNRKLFALPAITKAIFSLTSCSHRLVGTWNVARYETTTPGQQGVSLSNIGTMTFRGNNSGEKNLKYQVLGIQRDDQLPFKWTATEKYVSIENGGADFSKTWIILENKKKFQKWKSTDGTNQIQVIELKK